MMQRHVSRHDHHLLRHTQPHTPGLGWAQITGDNVLIARETARALGLGTRICTPEGLPCLPPDGRVPRDLGTSLAPLVLASDGFAQACPPAHAYA